MFIVGTDMLRRSGPPRPGARRRNVGAACAVCLAVTLVQGRPSLRAEPLPARPSAVAFPYSVSPVVKVAQLIGSTPYGPDAKDDPNPYSINDTTRWRLCRGDLGSLMISRGVGYIALGDNYSDCGEGKPGPNPPIWRSNALGMIPNPGDFTHGLHIRRWFSHDGRTAAQVIPSAHDAGNCQVTQAPGCEVTTIPTYSFVVQHRLFLAFMSVHHWNGGSWQVNYSSFAVSSNRGRTWHVESRRIRWGPNSNFAQVAVAPDPTGKYLLFYGIPAGTLGQVELMRARNTVTGAIDRRGYQYLTGRRRGRPLWSRSTARAAVDVQGLVGDPSVMYDRGLRRWLMTDLEGDSTIDLRMAINYWGPWSRPKTIATQGDYPGLYGAFMNPRFVTHNGHTIYFVMSQSGPYRIYWMRVRLTEG